MNRESPFTMNGWPAASNPFGLYLVLGMVLALMVVAVYAIVDPDKTTTPAVKTTAEISQQSKPASINQASQPARNVKTR